MQASPIPLPFAPTAICIPKDTATWLHNETIGALKKRLPAAVIRPSTSSSKDSLKFILNKPISAENGTILTQYTITFEIEKNRRKFYLSYAPEYRNKKGIIVERSHNNAFYEYVGAQCTQPSGELP